MFPKQTCHSIKAQNKLYMVRKIQNHFLQLYNKWFIYNVSTEILNIMKEGTGVMSI